MSAPRVTADGFSHWNHKFTEDKILEIRRAELKDINPILSLLSQVLEVHATIRPDLFISGRTKYTAEALENMIPDDENPIYVALNDNNVVGYVFAVIIDNPETNATYPKKEFYIDDLCVDENARGNNIATALFEYAQSEASRLSCDVITLNVWAGNTPAENFYRKMGMKPRKTMMEISL